MDTDLKAQLGYRLYWKRIAMHLNLRDIASELGVRSVELSAFEKGDFTRLTPEQLSAYLDMLELNDQAERLSEQLLVQRCSPGESDQSPSVHETMLR